MAPVKHEPTCITMLQKLLYLLSSARLHNMPGLGPTLEVYSSPGMQRNYSAAPLQLARTGPQAQHFAPMLARKYLTDP